MLESKRRAIIFLTISFVLAVTAAFLFLQKVQDLNSDLGGMTKVYTAATDIPSRTLITKESVETMEIPNKFVEESSNSYITDITELANQVLVVPVSEGQILTKSLLKTVTDVQNENHRLVEVFQSGKVFFDFFQNEVGAGDRVDIIVSHSFDGKPKTEVFMKDVQVKRSHTDGKALTGIEVEIRASDAPKLIHMQNYAESMRVLKANVAQTVSAPAKEEEEETEPAEQAESNPEKEEENTASEG